MSTMKAQHLCTLDWYQAVSDHPQMLLQLTQSQQAFGLAHLQALNVCLTTENEPQL